MPLKNTDNKPKSKCHLDDDARLVLPNRLRQINKYNAVKLVADSSNIVIVKPKRV